ncbi:MAG: acyltransferase [Lachnospiraceae bacterium]|jgi:acetyltransferase-like isoleucine patch superfamily enzyme|nr:acyltransferase [Lachnospiraceae bacterium]
MQSLKKFFKSHPVILNLLSLFYRIILINRKKGGKQNHIVCRGTFLKGCKIEIYGKHNEIIISPLAKLNHCHIFINGNYNHITIGTECIINKLEIWIEDTENRVEIGDNCWITGKTHLAVTEGTQLQIGSKCLLSEDIVMRTGDSHSIFNSEGKRINPAKSIIIASHVWIGNKTILLKGSCVGDNSIIGTGSIVTKAFGQGVLLAGVPAKPIKEKVYWSSERI